MTEWWRYRLEDFLLFSPETYQRLFELHNAAWWPWQLPAQALGVAAVWAAWRGGARGGALALAVLAVAWAIVAWVWHLQRYASVQWAAPWFAAGFGLQATLMTGWAAWSAHGAPPRSPGAAARRLPRARTAAALVVALVALVGLPGMPLALGRSWTQAESFALTPDPTALLTLSVLLLRPAPAWLWPLPLLWCAVTSATLWPMHAPHALLAPALGLAAVAVAIASRFGRTAAARR